MKRYIKLFTVCCAFFLFANSAHAIKKCKDADGNWHYGDFAVAECENSKVTTLSERGTVKEELAAPKTDAELQMEEEAALAKEAEEKRVKAEREERLRILSIYETEEDIDRQRDNQLGSVDSNIDVHEAYLKGMDARIARLEKKMAEAQSEGGKKRLANEVASAKKRMNSSEKELVELKKQKQDVIDRFANEKKVYKELKAQQ